jgi:hypothetical protein
MISIFLFGTFWFWLLAIITVICIVASVEADEANSWGIITLLAAGAIFYFGGNAIAFMDFINYAAQHPIVIVLGFFAYLILGTAYSFLKWYLRLTHLKMLYKNDYRFYKSKFEVSSNKQRILNWMIYWPFSGIWTLIDEPITKGFKRIFLALENQYEKITKTVTAELDEAELVKEKEMERRRNSEKNFGKA